MPALPSSCGTARLHFRSRSQMSRRRPTSARTISAPLRVRPFAHNQLTMAAEDRVGRNNGGDIANTIDRRTHNLRDVKKRKEAT
jgi:hypothetical protein